MPRTHPQNDLAAWLIRHSPISLIPQTFPSNCYLRHMRVQGRYQILLLQNTIFFMKAKEFRP